MKLFSTKALDFFETFSALCVLSLETTLLLRLANDKNDDEALNSQQVRTRLLLCILLSPLSIPFFVNKNVDIIFQH